MDEEKATEDGARRRRRNIAAGAIAAICLLAAGAGIFHSLVRPPGESQQQALAADEPDILAHPHLPHAALRFIIVLHHSLLVPQRQVGEQPLQRHLAVAVLPAVQRVDEALGEAVLLRHGGVHGDRRPIEFPSLG